jgi:hypothetical protein
LQHGIVAWLDAYGIGEHLSQLMSNDGREQLHHPMAAWYLLNIPIQQQLAAPADASSLLADTCQAELPRSCVQFDSDTAGLVPLQVPTMWLTLSVSSNCRG